MSDEFRPEDYMPRVPPPRAAYIETGFQPLEPTPRQPHIGYTLLLLLIGFILLLVISAVVIAVGVSLHVLPHSVSQASRGFPKTSILIEALTFGAPVTDQQIRNAATRYCRTSPCEVQCLRPFKLHAHL